MWTCLQTCIIPVFLITAPEFWRGGALSFASRLETLYRHVRILLNLSVWKISSIVRVIVSNKRNDSGRKATWIRKVVWVVSDRAAECGESYVTSNNAYERSVSLKCRNSITHASPYVMLSTIVVVDTTSPRYGFDTTRTLSWVHPAPINGAACVVSQTVDGHTLDLQQYRFALTSLMRVWSSRRRAEVSFTMTTYFSVVCTPDIRCSGILELSASIAHELYMEGKYLADQSHVTPRLLKAFQERR